MDHDRIVRSPAMSLIVRVWKEDGSVPQMRGEIENISTGEKRFFRDYWSLLNLIDAWRQDLEAVS